LGRSISNVVNKQYRNWVFQRNWQCISIERYKWAASWQNQHSAFASAQSDQDPCCSLSVYLLVIELISGQHGSWSDYADSQAGLDPCWSQTHYVGFDVTRFKCGYLLFLFTRNLSPFLSHVIDFDETAD
jgi:hypothetical protein